MPGSAPEASPEVANRRKVSAATAMIPMSAGGTGGAGPTTTSVPDWLPEFMVTVNSRLTMRPRWITTVSVEADP